VQVGNADWMASWNWHSRGPGETEPLQWGGDDKRSDFLSGLNHTQRKYPSSLRYLILFGGCSIG